MAYRIHPDRHVDPLLNPLRSFDLIAVAQVAPGILHVVLEDEFIHGCEHVEVTLPRDVIGSKEATFFINNISTHKFDRTRTTKRCIF